MPRYSYEVEYTEYEVGVIDAVSETDAEYLIEQEFDMNPGFRITKIEELVD